MSDINQAPDPWDITIEKDGDKERPNYIKALQKAGTYRFGVISCEKTKSKALVPMLLITHGIFMEDDCEFSKQVTTVTDNIVNTCEWKLCEFFRAIGERKHGERLHITRDLLANIPQATGKCELIVEEFTKKDGKSVAYNNKIGHYLDPDSTEPSEIPAQPDPKPETPASPAPTCQPTTTTEKKKKGLAF